MPRSFRYLFVVLFSLALAGSDALLGGPPDGLSVADAATSDAPASGSKPDGPNTSKISQWMTARGDAGATGATSVKVPDDLEIVWQTSLTEAIETTPVSDGRRIYVADVMGGVEALSLDDGGSVWRRDFDTGFVASPSLFSRNVQNASVDVSSEPILVVGDVEGNIYSLNPKTGETLWKQTTEGEINASANFFVDAGTSSQTNEQGSMTGDVQIRILQTSQDGNLYCFNAADGKLVWKYETGDQIRCAASIGNGKTFLGGCDGGLHVVDLATGKAASEPIPLNGPTGSTPAITDGDVFVPIMDGVLFAFRLKDEKYEERWQYEDPDRPEDYRGSVAIGKDVVVISSRNKHIDAIDRFTGQRLWRTTIRRRADASPLIAGDDVWIASTDGRLLRLSLEDGSERWSFEIKGGFFASPAIIDNRLIIADDEGVVRCFGKPLTKSQ